MESSSTLFFKQNKLLWRIDLPKEFSFISNPLQGKGILVEYLFPADSIYADNPDWKNPVVGRIFDISQRPVRLIETQTRIESQKGLWLYQFECDGFPKQKNWAAQAYDYLQAVGEFHKSLKLILKGIENPELEKVYTCSDGNRTYQISFVQKTDKLGRKVVDCLLSQN